MGALTYLAGRFIVPVLVVVRSNFRKEQHKYHRQSECQHSGRVPHRFSTYTHRSIAHPGYDFDAAALPNVVAVFRAPLALSPLYYSAKVLETRMACSCPAP